MKTQTAEYKKGNTPTCPVDPCPVCGADAELWLFSDDFENGPISKLMMCTNGDKFGPQEGFMNEGCLLYMPPDEFHHGRSADAVKFWNEYARALVAQRAKRQGENSEMRRRLYKALEDCHAYLKDGETPAECLARNRADLIAALGLLAQEKKKSEQIAAGCFDMGHAIKCMKACSEIPDGALDGGWTAAVLDAYARKLEQALRPFAEHPDFHAPDEWAVTIIAQDSRDAGVTAGDFRAAKNALHGRAS